MVPAHPRPLRWLRKNRHTSQSRQTPAGLLRISSLRYCASRPLPFTWANLPAHRRAFDLLGSSLGHSSLEDWYKIDTKTIRKTNCQHIVAYYYNESLYGALSTVYPEHLWEPWKFKQVPRNFWAQPANCRIYLDWLGVQLGFSSLDDWYQLSANDIRNNYGSGLLSHHGNSVLNLLAFAFPQHNWNPANFVCKPRRPAGLG